MDDGQLPHGIAHPSKLGTDLQDWAIWLRRTDDGDPASEPTQVVGQRPVDKHNAALNQAATLRGMIVH